MKTTDLFKSNRSSKKINESMEKIFGTKLDFASFDVPKLEDARNKLRTQLSQVRSGSGFNENIENEAVAQAQWMLDAINAEIAERAEFIVDPSVAEVSTDEGFGSLEDEVMQLLKRFDENANEIGAYGDLDAKKIVELLRQGDFEGAAEEVWYAYSDQDGGEVPRIEPYVEDLQAEFEALAQGGDEDEGGDTDDAYALASAGHGSDEDYGSFGYDEEYQAEDADEETKAAHNAGYKDASQGKKKNPYNPGSPSAKHYDDGQDSYKRHFGEGTVSEKAPPGAKAERMVKHIKKGYAKDGKLTDKEKSIAYATAWKQHNKEKNESTESGEDMTKLNEGEVQQASAIVTAKTMVDRVSRWIEELSGMENDTLLQLGDSIRDEMGQEQAKAFISQCAPAIQQALENLKSTRDTLSTSVRSLASGEQPTDMLGGEPGADMGAGDEMGPAEPDMMNTGGDESGLDALAGGDEFGASDAAAGGLEAAGREQRESIDRSNSLLRVLAG